jgi:hypothetical protein
VDVWSARRKAATYTEHKHRINYETVNLINNWYDSLDGWSARPKAATYTEHKHRINSEIMNLINNWYDCLDGWSARLEAATYTEHKHRINSNIHASSGFKPMITVFDRANTFRALRSMAIVIGPSVLSIAKFGEFLLNISH